MINYFGSIKGFIPWMAFLSDCLIDTRKTSCFDVPLRRREPRSLHASFWGIPFAPVQRAVAAEQQRREIRRDLRPDAHRSPPVTGERKAPQLPDSTEHLQLDNLSVPVINSGSSFWERTAAVAQWIRWTHFAWILADSPDQPRIQCFNLGWVSQ